MTRMMTYAQAVNESLQISLEINKNVICFGLGVDDPKGVFGTTLGLKEKFGGERVFDMPVAENGMTGIGIGAALNGLIPIMTHQRLDFFLLAMEQLVNNAAKWHYMFGGQKSVPLTIRLIIGMGWGQGPTHSQNLQAWFAHIPGLKVVCPTNAYDAKGLLLASIFDPNPVIYLEHRWLHNARGNVPMGDYRVDIGSASIVKTGTEITLVTMSYMVVECRKAAEFLETSGSGISVDLIDLRTLSPIDWELIYQSVKKTGRLLVVDNAQLSFSMSAEIIARVTTDHWKDLKAAPQRLGLPDYPTPTSFALTKDYYNTAKDVVEEILAMMGEEGGPRENISFEALHSNTPHDIPGEWFSGPF